VRVRWPWWVARGDAGGDGIFFGGDFGGDGTTQGNADVLVPILVCSRPPLFSPQKS